MCYACDRSYEKERYTSPVSIRDKCTRLSGLLQCLKIVIDSKDLDSYEDSPHLDLFIVMQDIINNIDEELKKL